MRKLLFSILAAGATLALAAPGTAQHRNAAAARARPSDNVANRLSIRIHGIQAQIDMLRYDGALSSEEAQQLRQQSRNLERRLPGLGRRDVSDVEFGLARLEYRVRFAADDARWRSHIYEREEVDRHVDRDQPDEHGYQGVFDRYNGSSVDRWHDPFDRGN